MVRNLGVLLEALLIFISIVNFEYILYNRGLMLVPLNDVQILGGEVPRDLILGNIYEATKIMKILQRRQTMDIAAIPQKQPIPDHVHDNHKMTKRPG